ncbi:MAG: MetQ/NlpA family ABC transporter substrate-binding protein [Ruthenibacterium sp.]
MMKKIRIFTAILCALALSACAAKPAASASAAPSAVASTSAAASASKAGIVLKVGASPAPHAEILEAAKPLLAAEGITLEIVEFDEYVLPNTALEEGDLDANYFQHKPYLDSFNEGNGTHLVSAAAIHYEPLGIYPGKTATVDALADGAKIAVPNDGSNEARALYLLEAQGVLKVDHAAGFAATALDVTENPKNIEIVELDADKIPSAVGDVDVAVINGNYAIAAGLTDTVLAQEDAAGESAKTYANIIAVREGDEARPEITALIKALQSDTVSAMITEKYKGSVVPMAGK